MGKNVKKVKLREVIQFFTATLLLLAIIFFVFKISTLLYEQQNRTPAEIESLSSSFLNIIQSIFFLITGILAFLSYLQARETIFSPIKTEIFKLQINALHEVLTFFYPKDEIDFLDLFDFDRIVRINSKIMVSQYSKIFFGKDNSVSRKIEEMQFKSHLGIRPLSGAGSSYPEDFEGEWKDYKHNFVYFTKKYQESTEKLSSLTTSPLLPTDLKELIIDFDESVTENLEQIGRTLTEVAKELPTSCTSLEEVSDFVNDVHINVGIWNRYVGERPTLGEKINAILDYINRYLRINQIIK